MALLKIATMGNPVLRARSQEVADPTQPAIHALIRDMAETMADAGGVGLAAPQVHVPLRIVLFRLPPARLAAGDGAAGGDGAEEPPEDEGEGGEDLGPLHVLINPVVVPVGEEMALGWEGCLSVPRMRGVVPRHTQIRYRGVGPDGKPIQGEARGFHARVIQHECDHLDGILYPMRITDLRLFGFNDELDRHPIVLGGDEETEEKAEAAATADAPAPGGER